MDRIEAGREGIVRSTAAKPPKRRGDASVLLAGPPRVKFGADGPDRIGLVKASAPRGTPFRTTPAADAGRRGASAIEAVITWARVLALQAPWLKLLNSATLFSLNGSSWNYGDE